MRLGSRLKFQQPGDEERPKRTQKFNFSPPAWFQISLTSSRGPILESMFGLGNNLLLSSIDMDAQTTSCSSKIKKDKFQIKSPKLWSWSSDFRLLKLEDFGFQINFQPWYWIRISFWDSCFFAALDFPKWMVQGICHWLSATCAVNDNLLLLRHFHFDSLALAGIFLQQTIRLPNPKSTRDYWLCLIGYDWSIWWYNKNMWDE